MFANASSSIQLVERLGPLVGGPYLVLCDVWGVLHNGREPFIGAGETLDQLRRQGHTVLLISNAPRRNRHVVKRLVEIGARSDVFDGVVTSGDVTRHLLRSKMEGRELQIYHFGPETDLDLFEGLALGFARLEEADLVVCTGLMHDGRDVPEAYDDDLRQIAAAQIPFICANPDIQVQQGNRLIYCAGALAERLKGFGGSVVYPGKPFAPIYDLCVEQARKMTGVSFERSRIIGVGDGLKTDMVGAARYGIASVFVLSGIHADDFLRGDGALDKPKLETAFKTLSVGPNAIVNEFVL